MNIARMADWTVRVYGEYDALIAGDHRWTNVELRDAATRLASALRDRGLRPGATVGLQLEACAELFIAVEAVLRAGGVAVPLSPHAPPDLLRRVLEHCEAVGVIGTHDPPPSETGRPQYWRIAVERGRAAEGDVLEFWKMIARYEPMRRPIVRQDNDPAAIQYSSGTTGVPKGVVQTHGRILAPFAAPLSRSLRQSRARRRAPVARRRQQLPVFLAAVPLWHAYGGAQLFQRMLTPLRLVLPASREIPDVLAAIERHEVTQLAIVPAFAEALLAAGVTRTSSLSSLQRIYVGGGPSTPNLIDRLETALRVEVVHQYGMTEGGGASTIFSPRRKPGSVGRPAPGNEMRVVDADGQPVPPGEVGEIEVRTSVRFAGYYRDDTATLRAMHGEWRRTGDLGHIDEDGDVFLTGRKDSLIVQGGTNIVAEDVDTVLQQIPDVADAAVAALDSAFLGQEMVACVVRRPGAAIGRDEVVAACRQVLEPAKMPSDVLIVDAIPRSDLGKVQRARLRRVVETHRRDLAATEFARTLLALPARARHDGLLAAVLAHAAAAIDAPSLPFDPERGFGAQGLTSLRLVQMTAALGATLGIALNATVAFEHSTPSALTRHLLTRLGADPRPSPSVTSSSADASSSSITGTPIAIIGMGCRFPGGAQDPETFWRMLCDGRDATQQWPAARFGTWQSRRSAATRSLPPRGGFVESVGRFDASFFGLTAREAERLTDSQRLFLEVVWDAIEDAAQAPRALEAITTGVHVGCMSGDAMLAGLTSYLLNLRGPSLLLNTACSSSLVAVHTAVEALRAGACDVVLAGGVHVIESAAAVAAAASLDLLSPDGLCKTFDAGADGIAMAEGCGVVVLKRLEDAWHSRDRIIAVIAGTAINHNGRSSTLTSPNASAQRDVIAAAVRAAGVQPQHVDFVEAHGTGTRLGDPVEVQAIVDALTAERDGPIVVGSVKTNIGHTQGAAGIAGLIKAAASVERGVIPPNLHFRILNPLIATHTARVHVPTSVGPWPETKGRPRTAGVTSMGLFGSNGHVIVQEPPPAPSVKARAATPPYVLCVSARDHRALIEQARRWADHLDGCSREEIANACYTSAVGRRHFEHRVAVVADDAATVGERLRRFTSGDTSVGTHHRAVAAHPKIAFLFTGQGSQYLGMGRELWERYPVFRDALATCDGLLRDMESISVVECLYGRAPAAMLDDTSVAQPALFSIEWALAQLWRSWGITPDVVVGHSLGDLAAACVGGAIDVTTALRWVVSRGRLMQSLPPGGAMASVQAAATAVRRMVAQLSVNVEIAGINAPDSVVVAGEGGEVDRLVAAAGREGIRAERLRVSSAFHSRWVTPILDQFERLTSEHSVSVPEATVVSSLTGDVVAGELQDPRYWRRHLGEPVQFEAAVRTCVRLGVDAFVEIGPDPVLVSLARRAVAAAQNVAWVTSLRRQRAADEQICDALAQLHVWGAVVDWDAVYAHVDVRRVALPTYPWGATSANDARSTKASGPWPAERSSVAPVRRTDQPPDLQSVHAVDKWLRQWVSVIAERSVDEIRPDTNLLEMGLDSLRVLDLLSVVARELNVQCRPADFVCRPTIAEFSSFLVAPHGASVPAPRDRRSIVRIRDAAGPLIFCIHPSGGEITCYLQFAERLRNRCVYAIPSRALEDPTREHTSFAAMAADYAGLIRREQAGPFSLLGWSFGAILAHAVAGVLEEAGEQVTQVVMIDPPLRGSSPLDMASSTRLAVAGICHEYTGAVSETELDRLVGSMTAEVCRAPAEHIFDWCVARAFLPREAISRDAFVASLELHRRHHELLRQYEPRRVTAPAVAWWSGSLPVSLDVFSRWCAQATHHGTTESHFSIMRPPGIDAIAAALLLTH